MKSIPELDIVLGHLAEGGFCELYKDLGGELVENVRCANSLWHLMSSMAEDQFGVRKLKEKFASGEEQGIVPVSMSEAPSVIASRAKVLMDRAGQEAGNPLHVAAAVALYCYGAVLCTDGLEAEAFPELFREAWKIVRPTSEMPDKEDEDADDAATYQHLCDACPDGEIELPEEDALKFEKKIFLS